MKPLVGNWQIAESTAFLGERIQADASQQISQAHGEAREASEIISRVRAEALEIFRQVVLFQPQDVQKRDHMLSEMQSKMQRLMIKIRTDSGVE